MSCQLFPLRDSIRWVITDDSVRSVQLEDSFSQRFIHWYTEHLRSFRPQLMRSGLSFDYHWRQWHICWYIIFKLVLHSDDSCWFASCSDKERWVLGILCGGGGSHGLLKRFWAPRSRRLPAVARLPMTCREDTHLPQASPGGVPESGHRPQDTAWIRASDR